MTLFMLLGVLILLAVGITLFLILQREEATLDAAQPQDPLPEQAALQSFVQSCAEQTLDDALRILGENGGHLPRPSYLTLQYTEDRFIAVLYAKRVALLPTHELIRESLERYLAENLRYCLDDLALFEEQGWVAQLAGVTADLTITNETLITHIFFPATVTRGNHSFTLAPARAQRQIALPRLLATVERILADVSMLQQELDAAAATRSDDNPSNDRPPRIEQLPRTFTRNGIKITHHPYPNKNNILWRVSDGTLDWYFATALEAP